MTGIASRIREVAAAKFGGLTGLCAKLGVSTQALHYWLSKRIPAERVLDVERATGIPREELRPDLYR